MGHLPLGPGIFYPRIHFQNLLVPGSISIHECGKQAFG